MSAFIQESLPVGHEPAKRCPKCSEAKPVSEFYRNLKRRDGLYGYCKKCSDGQSSSWKKRNASAVKQMRVRSKLRDPNRYRRAAIKSTYGLTESAYEAMLVAQNGKCAIQSCGKHLRSIFHGRSQDRKSLACVDHDHVTGRVRALLCNRCNYVVGCVEKHGDIVSDAHAYLRSKSC
jgi:hypothetical protein